MQLPRQTATFTNLAFLCPAFSALPRSKMHIDTTTTSTRYFLILLTLQQSWLFRSVDVCSSLLSSFSFVFAIRDVARARTRRIKRRSEAARLECVRCLVDRRGVTRSSSWSSPTSWRVETHEILPSTRVDDDRPRPSHPPRPPRPHRGRSVWHAVRSGRSVARHGLQWLSRNSPLNGRRFESALRRPAKCQTLTLRVQGRSYGQVHASNTAAASSSISAPITVPFNSALCIQFILQLQILIYICWII